jgi:hypothetical protein
MRSLRAPRKGLERNCAAENETLSQPTVAASVLNWRA